jgi:DNA-binding response OmpR family regulator
MSKQVLIVEDESDIREAMAEAVADAGFSVRSATNGQEGLAAALETHPDLILLDLRMPIMTGLEMLYALRADSWGKTAKVIVMTAMDDAANIAKAHEAGLSDYLIKTHTSLDELVKIVREGIYAE